MPKNHAKLWKAWRTKKLLSQRSLALALSITTRTITGIENGHHNPSLTNQRRFEELQERHRKNGAR